MVQGRSTKPWEFELYVNGDTRRSMFAKKNLTSFCEEFLNSNCLISVIDLSKNPKLGFDNNICATPTLIKRHPSPVRTLVGDLSDTSKVREYLGVSLPEKTLSRAKSYPEGLRKQDVSSKERHLTARR